MKRYPHTATLEITTEVDNGTGITGSTKNQYALKGRHEPAGANKSLDFSGKFFCPINTLFNNGNATGQRLNVNGRWFSVSEAMNFQSHAELWLD